jgi:ADP-ribose pyrophosphatase
MNDQGQLLLIQQYRHAIRSRDWEIPAGLLDAAGESPLAAAKRELAEEVDLLASDWAVLIDFATSPGGSNEVIRVFLARGLSAAPSLHEREAEEADIALHWLSLDEAVEAVLARTVRNGPLIVAILAAKAASERGWDSLGDPDSDWPGHPANRE